MPISIIGISFFYIPVHEFKVPSRLLIKPKSLTNNKLSSKTGQK